MTAFRNYGNPLQIDVEYASYIAIEEKGLTSLDGCPKRVDDFSCGDNPLISFEGGPKEVVKFKYDNQRKNTTLVSLEGFPVKFNEAFISNAHALRDINISSNCNGGVLDFLDCSNIRTISSLPTTIDYLHVANSKLSSLGNFKCSVLHRTNHMNGVDLNGNQIRSLDGIYNKFLLIDGTLNLDANPLQNCFLHVMFIKKLKKVYFNTDDDNQFRVAMIVNKYLPLGKAGLVKAQLELLNHGFSDYARI